MKLEEKIRSKVGPKFQSNRVYRPKYDHPTNRPYLQKMCQGDFFGKRSPVFTN